MLHAAADIPVTKEGLPAMQGNVGARRAAYEARWHSFGAAVAAGKSGLRYAEMPWPAEDPDGVRAVLLYGAASLEEVCQPPIAWFV
jgi:hypothetical protein